ncbi:MAG: SUMF1/EgtB/PvdO family nonheme iron enzyme [Opitutaceae bacterium]|nr:SUMF1/EgtB/PvdO family nonheme iron enzyme [Opitutaceae bacterium]
MNTHNTTQNTALLLATLLLTAGAATARGATVGTDYLSDPSLMVAVTGGSESRTHENGTYGAVDYNYYIGTYEVTNAQYAKFLNAVGVTTTNNDLNLYRPEQLNYGLTWSSDQFDGDNRPVVYVSFYDTARFVNWLTNGGTTDSDTETGMYTLSDGTGITRNADAWSAGGFAIANENEWYRAAYYDPTRGETGGFWDYATQSDNFSGDRNASNGQTYTGSQGDDGDKALEAGSFILAASYFGTYDQGGNVWEWNESIQSGTNRGLRGGSAYSASSNLFAASGRRSAGLADEDFFVGFRVVSLTAVAVPEPGAVAGVTGLAALVVGIWLRHTRLRRARRG